MVVMGVIPAREGSKGMADKNIRPFCGKPLIAWTIEEANKAKNVTLTIVSTDSEQIAEIAREYGACVPFLRPSYLAADDVPLWPVMLHAADWYMKEHGKYPDIIASLQPTSPLRTFEHIDHAIEVFIGSDAEALMSLTEVEHTPYKMRVISSGYIRPFVSSGQLVGQRQEAPKVYRLDGVINLIRYETLKREKALWSDKTIPIFHTQEEGFNIDTEFDFFLAEYIKKRSLSTRKSS